METKTVETSNYEHLEPINKFAEAKSKQLGVKPYAVKVLINRNIDELTRYGIVFKTRGKSRMVDPQKFMEWYLCQ